MKHLRAYTLLASLLFSPLAAEGSEEDTVATYNAENAQLTLETFARGWMKKLRNASETERVEGAVSYRGYSSRYKIELKETNKSPVPFIGVLQYQEHLVKCHRDKEISCERSGTHTVTEIFRFRNGRWIY